MYTTAPEQSNQPKDGTQGGRHLTLPVSNFTTNYIPKPAWWAGVRRLRGGEKIMKFVQLDRDNVFDNHENIFVIFDNQEYEVICVQRELEPPAEAVAEVDWPRRPHRYTHKMYALAS